MLSSHFSRLKPASLQHALIGNTKPRHAAASGGATAVCFAWELRFGGRRKFLQGFIVDPVRAEQLSSLCGRIP